MTAGATGPKTIEVSMRAMTTERVMAVGVKTRTTIESAARMLGMTATMRTTTEATTDRAPTTETMVVETMTRGTMTEATAKMDAMTTGTIASTIRTTAMTTTETEDLASSGVFCF